MRAPLTSKKKTETLFVCDSTLDSFSTFTMTITMLLLLVRRRTMLIMTIIIKEKRRVMVITMKIMM